MQCESSWAWRNVYPAKASLYVVSVIVNKIIGQRMTILPISRYVCDLDTSTVIKVYNHAYYNIYY